MEIPKIEEKRFQVAKFDHLLTDDKNAVLGSVRQKGTADNPINSVLYTEEGRDASPKGTLK